MEIEEIQYTDGRPPTFSELGFASEQEMMDDYNASMRDMSMIGYNGYTAEHFVSGPSYDEWIKQKDILPDKV